MALPDPFAGLVDSLPKGQREAYGFLRGLVKSQPDASANSLLTQLKNAGLGINRQAGLDIVAVLKNKADIPQFIRRFGENAIFPNSLHTIAATSFKSGHKVIYQVSTNSTNPDVPEEVFVGSQAPLSANQIYAAAISNLQRPSPEPVSQDDMAGLTLVIEDARYAPGQQTTGEFTPPEVPTVGFESFEQAGIEAGITKAYNQALADLKAGRITGPEFFQRTRGL